MLASGHHLPNSNHGQEAGIHHAAGQSGTEFDRRAIPSGAIERKWRAADGHAIRLIDWPAPDAGAPPRGAILFMAGRGDAYEKYLETFEHWRRQGWQVSGADWRGQAGSGRLGNDPVTGHIGDFTHWVDDLAALWSQWATGKQGPLVLAGHSMGGHLVLRAVAENALSPEPAALVLSTPMLGVHPQWLPLWLQGAASRLMTMLGDPRRPAWKWSEKPGELPLDRQALLTHDPARYADEGYWRDTRAELVMGPGSWGWVDAASRSMRKLARPGVLEAVRLPVFLLSTTGDKLVSWRASRRAAARLPDVEFLELGPEAAHEILRECDPVRDKALAAIDSFLTRIVNS
ncbi:alpha/beta hydrolase [Altererythrobacter sp. KTW20L]|uniref:alpha/beta fold hydrolase n=1 Tax=Altererythrobacter sp. KTW20L TaxID=2942210 RepID=UPI0020BFD3E7|nr:alpha/beta hydrolase [Altererythrobacter sp. KTW20L]MCL6250978.1 alpha/beta hydrolase [Altererythrobacter sp. KTW20L]